LFYFVIIYDDLIFQEAEGEKAGLSKKGALSEGLRLEIGPEDTTAQFT